MAPVKSAESSTSVWSVFRAPEMINDTFKALNKDSTIVIFGFVNVQVPDGMVSESVESRLLHSSSGFSAPVSCGIIRLGWGAKMAEVTTALCAETPVRFAVNCKATVLHWYAH